MSLSPSGCRAGWADRPPRTYKFLTITTVNGEGCDAAGAACTVCNAVTIENGDWPSFDATGNLVPDLAAETFLEFGMNVDLLLGTSSASYTGIQITTPQDFASGIFTRTATTRLGGPECFVAGGDASVCSGDAGNCMENVAGFGLNCTANDISLAEVSVAGVLTDDCEDGFITLMAGDLVADVLLTAQARFDVGIYLALDGGDGLCGLCEPEALPTPPADDNDGDVCGDIDDLPNPISIDLPHTCIFSSAQSCRKRSSLAEECSGPCPS